MDFFERRGKNEHPQSKEEEMKNPHGPVQILYGKRDRTRPSLSTLKLFVRFASDLGEVLGVDLAILNARTELD